MMDWEFRNVFDEWEGEEWMSNFLAVGGNHPIVPPEVADRYSIKVHLKLLNDS